LPHQHTRPASAETMPAPAAPSPEPPNPLPRLRPSPAARIKARRDYLRQRVIGKPGSTPLTQEDHPLARPWPLCTAPPPAAGRPNMKKTPRTCRPGHAQARWRAKQRTRRGISGRAHLPLELPLLQDFPDPGRSHRFPCSSAPRTPSFPRSVAGRRLLAHAGNTSRPEDLHGD